MTHSKLINLDLEQRSIKVHGKGAKDRRVYFGKYNYTRLKHWLNINDNFSDVSDDTILTSQNRDKEKALTISNISDTRKGRFAARSSFTTRVKAYFATLAIQHGLDPFSLKRQFGWEQMSSALKYVHVSDKTLQEPYRTSSLRII